MLALLMVVSIIPMSALAESVYFDYESETHTVFQSIKSTLAPGVTSSTNYAYATSDGEQMVYYVATADIARDDVELHSTFKDASIEATGMETLTNQMKAANNKYQKTNPYFQSVAGINADAFNMTTGKPQGAFYMDGKTLQEGCKNFPWFAVFEDGTAWCGAGNTDWDAAIEAHGKPMEAVGGFQLIMRDGETVAHADSAYCGSKRYPRSLVGVTAEGKVVIVGIDGNQKPFSVGANYDECFQIMKEQGCVQALCLDGGGSATFVTRPEGENDIKLTNRPSDGSERSVSSGLVLATTTPPSNVFERATLTAEDLYITPGTTTNISAMGISPAGSAAVIPNDVTYEATNGTFENGVFTAGELAEDAVVSMCYNGKVVGSVTIHVVVPEKIEFQTETMTVPYSAKVGVNLTAFYGLNEVKIKPSDINFVLENSEIGELNGFDFIATDGNATVAQSKLTANVVADASVSAETLIKLGKGSEVVYSFEDEAQMDAIYGEGMPNYNYVYPETKQWLANKETGKVHSGNHSFGVNFNYSNSLESGYMGTHLVAKEDMVFENATRIGMWIYIPDEAVGLWPRWIIRPITIGENGEITYGDNFNGNDLDGVSKGASTGFVSKFNESGWHYLSIDTSKYPAVGWKAGSTIMQFYISDRDGSDHGYDHSDYPNQNGNYTFYID
ncbi:MAG: phosphodiester glycosidase family protein, partial [Clostridia bacterium]|nr:phosphodiester glycosidase family protein [Clostridia bacterium]